MKKVFSIIIVASVNMLFAVAQKPNSNFGGVQIGVITYSYRNMPDQKLEGILDYIVQSGINSVQLLGGPVEQYAGVPRNRDEARKWRTSVSMDNFKEIKAMFNERGVNIHMIGLGINPEWSDEEIDYAFNVCRTLGAKGISLEVSEDAAIRLAPFAEKHKLYIIFHNHNQPGNPNFSFDKILSHGAWLMLNLDVGHYYGATGLDPCDLIKCLNKRIVSLHIKDKTEPNATPKNANKPFGDGETPVVEILQLIQKEKWPIYCDIELEYKIPEDSDDVKEMIKCVDYCRKALTK